MEHGKISKANENPLDILDWDEFDYLTPGIETLDPSSFLPIDASTIANLKALGATMSSDSTGDSTIPATYTYLGQFIDHDISLTASTDKSIDPDTEIGKPNFQPLNRNQIRTILRNRRTSSFDLDCLYGLKPLAGEELLEVPFTSSGDQFAIGTVSTVGNRPPGKSDDNDLPRVGASAPNAQIARRARIGDKRNDENTIVAQLHLAFLKFHNNVVKDGFSFDEARRLVTHHYQWIVLLDFLPRICDPTIVRRVIEKGNKLYKPNGNEKFMPLEYAVAAYRFGHSMVRKSYDFNLNFKKVGGAQSEGSLDLLFKFSGLTGDMAGHPTLPENWIIQWEMMFQDKAMNIDPTLTTFLAQLPGQGAPTDVMLMLAKRNLLKGYLFGLPTGQALAQLTLPATEHLNSTEMEQACRPRSAGETESQWDTLKRLGFHTRTPLWFYLLAEAKAKGGGNHLGPLGSLIVAETIIGLMRANPDSILNAPFVPTLGASVGRFDLQDLFVKAGVLGARTTA